MDKLKRWKSRGFDYCRDVVHSTSDKTNAIARNLSDRRNAMKRMLVERRSQVKLMIHDTMSRADHEFHENPTKWAGIAAGATFVLGMIGREVRHHASRARARRMMPDLIIIETA
jgi:ElaB/YqjD/DUF883 family membrane-anchored ribosome-binding protein